MRGIVFALFALGGVVPLVGAAPFEVKEPLADRWMYPHNNNPGGRNAVSVFGAVGEDGADDRFGQAFVRFDTTGIVAAGLGVDNYAVSSLRLTMTVNLGNSLIYDPTYDGLGTYLDAGTDADAGRPIELFGVGYRNGFSATTFEENSAFGPSGGMRNAFAAGFDAGGVLIDVSNNVYENFEAVPCAVGLVAGVAPGGFVPEDVEMTFDLNLADPFVLAYVQESFNAGFFDLMVTSLATTEQMAGSGFASFYTKESIYHDVDIPDSQLAGKLSGNVVAVPEPGIVGMILVACVAALSWRMRSDWA